MSRDPRRPRSITPASRGQAAGKVARAQEDRIAREIARDVAHRQRGSGNQVGNRGDVVAGRQALGEAKFTTHASYGLKRAELQKIEREALAVDRVPWFEVEFRDTPLERGRDRWVMIPWWVAREVLPWLGGGDVGNGSAARDDGPTG